MLNAVLTRLKTTIDGYTGANIAIAVIKTTITKLARQETEFVTKYNALVTNAADLCEEVDHEADHTATEIRIFDSSNKLHEFAEKIIAIKVATANLQPTPTPTHGFLTTENGNAYIRRSTGTAVIQDPVPINGG
ncbi:unnamed protein product [Allacma fusca]|uniref:Uncharacterized protein n=1 Tax=Allacma fusca TaxID=39272 RepID=A0A8J2KAD8_9HEXA|nr:unnamed protein product [Allacma fusca]